jgi:dipeptidyl aminopeptidase/acylaminoacyl peptidase
MGPRVARHELPWGNRIKNPQPQRGCRNLWRTGRNPFWILFLFLCVPLFAPALADDISLLANEVANKGWIVFPARSEHGDPDGSHCRPLTRTSEWNEAAPQFSRDGRKLLYRRLKRDEKIEGNRYGEQGCLVVVNTDGTGERILGADGELPWASWSPDGQEFATLSIRGVTFVDSTTGQVRRTFPRKGLFQQLTWSPDGTSLIGVANSFGTGWSIARMNAENGEVTAVNTVDCCTPDWFPDAHAVIFSWRPPGQKTNRGIGWTQLWRADADGKNRRLIYGEDGRHIYGGHISPDGQYALFTGNPEEDGDPQHAGAPMGLVRLSDTPIIGGASPELRAHHAHAKTGPVLVLRSGWEPCWTYNEISFNK